MKINDAWLITLVIQIGIALINISAENWSGMMGGIFGAWMCFIYWEKHSNKPTPLVEAWVDGNGRVIEL